MDRREASNGRKAVSEDLIFISPHWIHIQEIFILKGQVTQMKSVLAWLPAGFCEKDTQGSNDDFTLFPIRLSYFIGIKTIQSYCWSDFSSKF